MTEISASFSTGHVAYYHDIREGNPPKNVDPALSRYNCVLVDELHGRTIEQYTNERMQPYIDEYNRKQKRKDRKIKLPYSEWHFKYSKSKSRETGLACPLVYEAVYQLGDHETLGKLWFDTDQKSMGMLAFYKREFQTFLDHFREKYPHMEVVWAVIHMDEPNGTPHMHIAYQPIGEGYKQGLSHQVSIGCALTQDGVDRVESRKEAEEIGGYQLKRFYREIEDYAKGRVLSKNIETILGEHVELKERIEGREHLEPQIFAYRAEKKEKEIEYIALWEELLAKRDLERVQEQITTSNILLEENEYAITEQVTQLNIASTMAENAQRTYEVYETRTEKKKREFEAVTVDIDKANSLFEHIREMIDQIIPAFYEAFKKINIVLAHWFEKEEETYLQIKEKTDAPIKKGLFAKKSFEDSRKALTEGNIPEITEEVLNCKTVLMEATEEMNGIVDEFDEEDTKDI